MPFQRPILTTLIDRVKSDIRDGLGIGTIVRRSLADVLAKAIAGMSHSLHGHIQYYANQLLPDSTETDIINRWGAAYAVDRKTATYAQLNVTFTGTDDTTIPASTTLTTTSGLTFTTDVETEIQTAVTGIAEISTVTTVADVAGSLDGTYFLLSDDAGSVAVWIDVDNSGTTIPDIAASADRAIAVTTIATGDSANTVATKIAAIMDADDAFSASAVANVITITNATTAARTDITAETSGFTVAVTQQGVDAVTGGEVTTQVTATMTGTDSNLSVGDTLTLTAAIAGVESTCTVASVLTTAIDDESDAAYQARYLARLRQPPSGGNPNDYIAWATAVGGVTRAWVFPNHLGFGTVGVACVEDGEDNIIPDSDILAAVQSYIDDPSRRPVTADVTVFAPVSVPLNPTIALNPNTQTVRDAVESELRDLLVRDANPGNAYKNADERYTGTILLSRINEAISIASGESDHRLVSPAADVTVNIGELVTLGTITWQTL